MNYYEKVILDSIDEITKLNRDQHTWGHMVADPTKRIYRLLHRIEDAAKSYRGDLDARK